MASVSFVNVKKSYGNTDIVKGISLDIADGEFLVLVGPSGCGKSTCMRMVAGLEEITSGALFIDGKRVNDTPPKDRDIGMVFQSYALYPHMSVRENIAFGLSLRRVDKGDIARTVDEVARMLDLTSLLDRKPAQLSGGQRQRVAMGRAIARRPRVYLFDEPLSNLDTALRVKMRSELAALHQKLKTTTIYVTHDQVEAMTLASRIAVLNAGVLQQVGTPDALYRTPANVFVAQFIGSPSMNVMRATGALEKISNGASSIGFRPHDCTLVQADVNAHLAGRITAVEHLGHESFVHVACDGISDVVVVKTSSDVARAHAISDHVHVSIDVAHLHRFDAQGLRLSS